jgi:hypothetical protein
MRFGMRTSRTSGAKASRPYRPAVQALEDRVVLALDLTNIASSPLGILEAGLNGNGGAGFSVAEVGDVNGDGFDDFVVGAPSVTINANGTFDLGNGSSSRAFLIFGSRQVPSPPTVNFATLTAQQRVGDLGNLGNTLQNNPINGAPGFAFAGLTFLTGQNSNSQLGASVTALGDINGDGFDDFMIGAPGANGANGANPGTGRAYLIYGGAVLATRPNKTVDLDNPSANTDLNILTFTNTTQPGSRTGRGVAGVGDVFTDGTPDIAIGAPNASVNGVANSGAVYLINGAALRPARTQTIDLANVGQAGANGIQGVIFAGANPGDQAGTAVSSGGDFDNNQTSAKQPIGDILIGAPATGIGPGAAYLVYGALNLSSLARPVNGVQLISLGRVGSTDVPGAVFTGDGLSDETGFAVATAGDFNGDGVGDILIGSPGFQLNTGRATLIFGRPGTPTTPGRITGTFDIGALPAAIQFVEFDGQSTGALAGYSVTAVGRINNDALNEIAIGSPGLNGGRGAAYLIPGNADLTGTVVLSPATIEIPTIAGQTITLSTPASTNLVGTSVSGRLTANRAGQTVDADAIGDLVIGSAGFQLDPSRVAAGGVYLLEGRFIPLAVPVSTAITSDIGVEKANPPFVVNPTTPPGLQIFIESRNRNDPNFVPFRDIDPNTIEVNGVPLPDPTTFKDVPSVDGDNVDDAVFTFSPRSLLGLTAATTTLTVTARTSASSPLAGRRYTGTATIQVTGGGGRPGGWRPRSGR